MPRRVFNPSDPLAWACLRRGDCYIDLTGEEVVVVEIEKKDFTILGWVRLRNGKIEGNYKDVKKAGDAELLFEGKKYPEGTYYVVYYCGKKELIPEEEINEFNPQCTGGAKKV